MDAVDYGVSDIVPICREGEDISDIDQTHGVQGDEGLKEGSGHLDGGGYKSVPPSSERFGWIALRTR